jgi:hypothetical protein
MRTIPPESIFFILLVTGTMVLLLPLFPSVYWSVCLMLTVMPGLVLYIARRLPDRAFYLICAGQPAAIACGSTTLWAGLVVELMLAGMVAGTMGLLLSREDYLYLFLFAGLATLLSLLARFAGHVFLITVALGAVLLLVAGAMAVRGYRFRKQYLGARP